MSNASYMEARPSLLLRVSRHIPLIMTLFVTGLLFAALLLGGAENHILVFFFSGLFLIAAMVAQAFSSSYRHLQVPLILSMIVWLWYLLLTPQMRSLAIHDFAVILGVMAIWLIAALPGTQPELRDRISRALIIMGLLYSILVFALQITSLNAVSTSGESGAQSSGNALTASLGSADNAALVFSLLSLLATSRILRVWKRHYWSTSSRWTILSNILKSALPAFLLLIFSFSCLLMTASQSGILTGLAALFGLGLMEFLFWPGHIRTRLRGISYKFLVPAGALMAMVTIWTNKFLAGNQAATIDGIAPLSGSKVAFALAEQQFGIISRAPLFGHGPGSFETIMRVTTDEMTAPSVYSPQALDNFLMRGFIEYGVVGVGLILFIAAILIRSFLKHISRPGAKRSSSLFALAVIWIWFTNGLMSSSVNVPAILWLATLLTGLAYARTLSDKAPEKDAHTSTTEH